MQALLYFRGKIMTFSNVLHYKIKHTVVELIFHIIVGILPFTSSL